MAARATVHVEGFDELERRLKALPEGLAKRGTMRAMRRAAGRMQEAVVSRAPIGPTGNLRKSIRIRAKSTNLTGLAEYAAALKGGRSYRDAQQALRAARSGGGSLGTRITVSVETAAPHAHLVEFGTVERFHKSGKGTGAMPMDPFFRPAFDAAASGCLLDIERELKIEVLRMEARVAPSTGSG